MTEIISHRDNFQHLLPRYVAVAIEVVHAERPFELLLKFSSRSHRESAQKFPEVDRSVAIGVKRSEDVLRKLNEH